MLSYYRKFHTYTSTSKEVCDLLAIDYMKKDMYGESGPIQMSFGDFHGVLHQAWPETFKLMKMN